MIIYDHMIAAACAAAAAVGTAAAAAAGAANAAANAAGIAAKLITKLIPHYCKVNVEGSLHTVQLRDVQQLTTYDEYV